MTTPPKILLVTGSRRWDDRATVDTAISEALNVLGVPAGRVALVWGGAAGLDQMAAAMAKRRGLLVPAPHLPDWRQHGRQAGMLRNLAMVEFVVGHSDPARDAVCAAFAQTWDSGTGHCARAARRAGIRTRDYGVDTRAQARDRGDAVRPPGSRSVRPAG